DRDWAQTAGPLGPLDGGVPLSIQAAVDGVNQSIAASKLWLFDEGGCQETLARLCEGDVHRIVHPTGHDDIDRRVPRTPAKNVRRLGHKWRLAWSLVGLLGEGALGPVDPSVRSEVWTVQVVCAAGQGFSLPPLFALIGDAIAVGVGQLPDARRRRNVERS